MNRIIGMTVLALVAATSVAAQDRDGRYQDDRGYPQQDGRPGYPGPGYPQQGYPQQGYGSTQVRCESWQYRPARCAIDTRGGVGLVQLLGGNCVQGQTWGYDRGGIWVGGGCRAVFASGRGGYPGPGGGYPGGGGGGIFPGGGGGNVAEITCESWQYQPARCAAGYARRADVVQVYGGDCIQGRTWGIDRGAIWVTGGCRARFRIY